MVYCLQEVMGVTQTAIMIESRLSRLLGERRMKLSELARASGVSYQTLWKLYHDKTARADFATLDAICRTLDVGVGDILEYREEREVDR
jgi:putative transcriptional regulator